MKTYLNMHTGITALLLGANICQAVDDGTAAGAESKMMVPTDDDGDFSLADLADLDVSDIEEIRFSQLPTGVYLFEVESATLEEGVDKDNIKRFLAVFKFKVLEAKSILDPSADKDLESYVGKTHTEKLYIRKDRTQQEIQEAIGRLRAFVADLGCESAGKLGEIVKGTIQQRLTAKVVHKPDPNDRTQSFARLKLDAPKKKAA